MNNTRNFTLVRVAFLALLATVLSAGLLSAEDYEFTFTLPCETRWGKATLPPGDYSMTVDTARPDKVATVRGEHAAAFVWPMGTRDRQFAGHSVLILVRHGRSATVLALHLATPGPNRPNGGLLFSYGAPKGERPMLAQAPELLQRIPIAVNGK